MTTDKTKQIAIETIVDADTVHFWSFYAIFQGVKPPDVEAYERSNLPRVSV
jgi:hypothetical protein